MAAEQEDLRNLLPRAITYIGSSEGQEGYKRLSEAERAGIITGLEEAIKSFRIIEEEKLREQMERFVLQLGEYNNPNIAIQRMFRTGGGGKYLDFSNLTDKIFDRFHKPMKITINFYREHMEVYGHNSIAHLCLDGPLFFDLTHSLELHRGGIVENIKIDTIEQLRIFKKALEGPNIRLVRKMEYLRQERVYFSGAYYGLSESIQKNNMHDKLESKLAEWDAISKAELTPL